MVSKPPVSTATQLNGFVEDLIPNGRLEVQQLGNGIKLLLMNPDYPQDQLPAEAALKLMDQPVYWAFCWASGLVLSSYLLENSDLVRGKTVLDFGCGSGVVAIAAAKAGAKRVIACDIDALALQSTECNAELNGVKLDIRGDFYRLDEPLDMICVADVLYDRDNLPLLEDFLQRADQVLVADSRVRDFDYPPYRMVARREGCTMPDLDESREFRDVRLYASWALD